jgi:hypothetical protein
MEAFGSRGEIFKDLLNFPISIPLIAHPYGRLTKFELIKISSFQGPFLPNLTLYGS